MNLIKRYYDILYALGLSILIIGGSIGVGYAIKHGTKDISKPEIIKEHLFLECKKTGRNYDCNPKEQKKKVK